MQVTILAGLAGEPFQPGEVVDLPADRAKQLLAEGRAEAVAVRQVRQEPAQVASALEVADDRPRARRRPSPKE